MRKYLLYALGEILLVVIGILIALQVNNWNESRKEEQRAEKAIERLFDESQEIVLYFRNENGWIQTFIDDLDLTTKALHNGTYSKLDPDNVLVELGLYPTPWPPRNIYDELTNSGEFKEISSTEVRNAVIDYYRTLAFLEGQMDYFRTIDNDLGELAGPAITSVYDEKQSFRKELKLDLKALSENTAFKSALVNGLRDQIQMQNNRKLVLEMAINMCEVLAESLDKECTSKTEDITIMIPSL